MAITDTIKKLFEYRENISNIIRLKDIDIPENTMLRNIPQYINELEKKEHIEAQDTWTQEFQDQCVAESLANLLHERSLWNGHVDADGLREIGWTEDDIDYFQSNGVDWNKEDDDLYLVSDYEKELYRTHAIRVVTSKTEGAATYTSALITNNDPQVVEWRNTIKWMPKFTTDAMPTTINFRNFKELIGCPTFDFSKTTNPSYMFARCDKLRCIPPISFVSTGTSTWNGEYMFYECAKIKSIPSSINWEKCNKATYVFGDCLNLLFLPEMDLSNITSLNNTFTNCLKLISISQITTSNKLTNTADAFAGCRGMLTVPLFETNSVTTMQNMFGNCQSLFNIPTYNTNSNTTFNNFFKNCTHLLSCPNFNFTNKITTYADMFIGCEKLIQIPSNFNFESCTNISEMFYRCLSLTEIPIKFNLNNTATTPAEGIKSYNNCIYQCSNLKKVDIGLFKHTATNVGSGGFITYCPFIEEINVDDVGGGQGNPLASADLFQVVRIGGELKGINKSLNISVMRKLPREAMLKIINAVEDVTGTGTTPTLTFGTEALRNLTAEEKLIATNKGWKLA